MMSLAQNIRAARIAAGMSQARLAVAVGMSVSAVTKIESGKRMPSLRSLAMFARVFCLTTADLLSHEPLVLRPASSPPHVLPK